VARQTQTARAMAIFSTEVLLALGLSRDELIRRGAIGGF
jgi:hypothetical protein